jgi:glycosyltransferase involved in cell wall biosynthesis
LRNRFLIGVARGLELFFYRQARRIVAVTRGIGEGIEARGLPPDKVVFVPNGVDDILVEQGAEATRAAAGVANGRFLCIYVGALGIWNGNETILDAADRLKDRKEFHFLFVGDGDQRPELERRARAAGLSSVRFVGALPKREAVRRLLEADLCLVCTWDHPFHRMVLANKIFDYLSAARPVVAAAEGEMAELIAEAGAGESVPPGDGAAMARAIAALSALPAEERRAMGQRGREYVLRNYRRRDLARRAETVMRDVLEEEGHRPA